MNIVACYRVSTKEQADDGYSLEAQQRMVGERASREGWHIIKEFQFSETAFKADQRRQFNAMLSWVEENSKEKNIGGILWHKLDRALRNMLDAYKLQKLQESGIELFFIDNQFPKDAAGRFSFNVMAAMSTYFSENLRAEVLKGMNQKAENGWLPSKPPLGYYNDTPDEAEPIKINADKAKIVQKIFELYAQGETLDKISASLKAEGHGYFHRNTISNILNNRFYVGDLVWHGRLFQGKHKPIISRQTFEMCQDRLAGKNRRFSPDVLDFQFGGGLFRTSDGIAITGERIAKRHKDGSLKYHIYYKAKKQPIRWREDKLEAAIVAELAKLKLPDAEITEWFRRELGNELKGEEHYRTEVLASLHKREGELEARQNRLLDAMIDGSVSKAVYAAKNQELVLELEKVRADLATDAKANQGFKELAVAVFNFSQNAVETWLGSNSGVRRRILEAMSSNRVLDAASLTLTWRKPFDALAKQPVLEDGVPAMSTF